MSEDDFSPHGRRATVFDPAVRGPRPDEVPVGSIAGGPRATPDDGDIREILAKGGIHPAWEKWDLGLERGLGGIDDIIGQWGPGGDGWEFGDGPAESLGGDPRDGFDGGLGRVSIGLHVHIVVVPTEPDEDGEQDTKPTDIPLNYWTGKRSPPVGGWRHEDPEKDEAGATKKRPEQSKKGYAEDPYEGFDDDGKPGTKMTPDPMREDTGRGPPTGILWRMIRERGINLRPGVSDPQWMEDDRGRAPARLGAEQLDLLIGGGVTDPVPYGDDDPRRLGHRSGGVAVRPKGAKSDDPSEF